jgi:hypothetical protein
MDAEPADAATRAATGLDIVPIAEFPAEQREKGGPKFPGANHGLMTV